MDQLLYDLRQSSFYQRGPSIRTNGRHYIDKRASHMDAYEAKRCISYIMFGLFGSGIFIDGIFRSIIGTTVILRSGAGLKQDDAIHRSNRAHLDSPGDFLGLHHFSLLEGD